MHRVPATLFCWVSLLFAQIQPVSIPDNQGTGNIDWSKRLIFITGIGAPNPDLPSAAQRPAAIRAAQQVALRNALETIKGICLNSSTTVSNYMTQSDIVSSNVNGYVNGFEQDGETKYMSDGSVEISMKIPLDGVGGLGKMLYDPSVPQMPSVKFENTNHKKTIFSGLIIDCRGLKVKPALSPKVLDESGREVYGSAYVSREWAIKNGMVGYSKDLANATKLIDRIGNAPGQIKALKTTGNNGTDIIISNKDANDVRSTSENLKFLSECRIVFVID
jgi:hypothetical protein